MRRGSRLTFGDIFYGGIYAYDPATGRTDLLFDLMEGQLFAQFSLLGGGDEDLFANLSYLEAGPFVGTDATPDGTRRVLQTELPGISFGNGIGRDEETPVRDDHIFLLAWHPGGSRAIWATDATASGTFQVSTPTSASAASFCDPAALGDRVLFPVSSGPGSTQLWVSDGTPAGTSLSAVLPFSFLCSDLSFALQSRAVYTCSTGPGVRGLCLTDGTGPGTEVVEVSAAPNFSGDAQVAYFRGWTGGTWSLWRSDGTAQGTFELEAANALNPPSDLVNNSAAVPRGLVFNLFPPNSPSELWIASTDGTEVERLAVPCDSSEGCSGLPSHRVWRVGDVALFFAFDAQRGLWLWATDGTGQGTVPILDVNGIAMSDNPQFEASEDGRWYFLGTSAELGEELYVSDGTASGSRRLTNLANPGAITNSGFVNLQVAILGDRAWFSATELGSGHQIFSVSPLFGGVVQETHWSQASDGYLGAVGGRPGLFAFERICFANSQAGLWASNGSPASTFRILFPTSADCAGFPVPTTGPPFSWGPGLAAPWRGSSGRHQLFWLGALAQDAQEVPHIADGDVGNGMEILSAAVYQVRRPDSAWELWASDAPQTDPRLIGALPPDAGTPGPFQRLGGLGLFLTAADDHACDVIRTDGSVGGTFSLGFAAGNYYCPGAAAFHVTQGAGRGYFLMRDASTAGSIWETRGNVEDTLQFTSSTLDVLGFLEPSILDGRLVFAADEPGLPSSLYSQPLDSGTASRLTELAPPPPDMSGLPTYAAATSRQVFMTGYDSDHGQELWVADGDGKPFRILRDIAPGARSSHPQNLTVVSDYVLFSANDDSHGRELWISDGTPAGTRMVWEVAQGAFSSAPYSLSVIGDDLLFTAYHPLIGREPWILHLGPGTPGLIFDDDFESGSTAQWELSPE